MPTVTLPIARVGERREQCAADHPQHRPHAIVQRADFVFQADDAAEQPGYGDRGGFHPCPVLRPKPHGGTENLPYSGGVASIR